MRRRLPVPTASPNLLVSHVKRHNPARHGLFPFLGTPAIQTGNGDPGPRPCHTAWSRNPRSPASPKRGHLRRDLTNNPPFRSVVALDPGNIPLTPAKAGVQSHIESHAIGTLDPRL